MKKILLILSFIILFSCTKEPEPFYDFDTVDYYHVDINQDERMALFDRQNNPEKDDKVFWNLFFKDMAPETLKDKEFIANLKRLYKVQGTIDKKYYAIINNIFSEKFNSSEYTIACEPEYRDILIFKKDNRITGIAKICFECEKSNLIGTIKKTAHLGNEGDFSRLQGILNGQKK